MTGDQIEAIQRKIGTIPDRKWGPKSRAECQAYLRSLMPAPNPWPDKLHLRQFYGDPADESNLTNLGVSGLGVEYEGKPVSTVRCNRKIAEALHRVLFSLSETHRDILANYAGCYNYRPQRGGSSISMHAFAAIDLDPDSNGNNTPWPQKATMPLEVMEAFAREGAFAAGAFWGRDAIHFEFVNQ